MTKITTDTILDHLKMCVEEKIPIDPHTWLDASMKLLVLSSNEIDKLLILQQDVATAKLLNIELGDSVAKATAKVEASEVYKQMKRQLAFVENIQEMVRIAKIQARLSGEEMRGQSLG